MSADRSEYTLTLNGLEHTVLMTAEEAEKAGAVKDVKVESKQAEPANKARSARSK